ncbi:RNA-directed DNA polymerase [Phyllobacterium sp. A18/5-2]|uniref:RNA-directed DNA polymerase n=1 Tax=Phyllobacterium sp. A18/5-2 TaxID=2978392 RepID=UPI0021C587A6|nr:RNA-directed DNA polymerase [Phyllobacterium sp. A18/5-2]UXN65605.1 RNA-directed DNA polymerase [Phyllobacterium sp. A18/5-2]
MRKQLLPDPVDYMDVQASIDRVVSKIRTNIKTGTFSIEIPRGFHVEKSMGLCRLMVQPSVEEAIILQCLSDKMYSEIKRQSPSKNAFFEPSDHSFKTTAEQEYGTFKSWKKFQEEILKFSIENKFVIVTDISNYYDFIDLVQMRNVITSFVKVEEPLLDFLLHIVSNLVWRPDFMPPRQIGLPQMDLDAPRLLAHCYLFELDKFMEDRSQKNYARFMDDIDAGVNTIELAKKLLRDTDLVLQSRSLRLNAGKTKILSASEAYRHFRVKENRILDGLELRIEKIDGDPKLLTAFFNGLSVVFERLYTDGKLKEGNGEKIIKRIVGVYNKYKYRIPDALYGHFLKIHPNLRDVTLRNSSICGFRRIEFLSILSVFHNGLVCDDYFKLVLAKRLVEGAIEYDGSEASSILEILGHYDDKDNLTTYGRLWILSRFGTPKLIYDAVKKSAKVWANDSALSRLVAGLLPQLKEDSAIVARFYRLISDRGLPSAHELLNFHNELYDGKHYSRLKAIIKSTNNSLPLQCSHEKLLVIRSILASTALPPAEGTQIRKVHSGILTERSYDLGGIL